MNEKEPWEKEFERMRKGGGQFIVPSDAVKSFIKSLLDAERAELVKEVEGMKGIYDENGLQTQWIQKAELLQALDNLK